MLIEMRRIPRAVTRMVGRSSSYRSEALPIRSPKSFGGNIAICLPRGLCDFLTVSSSLAHPSSVYSGHRLVRPENVFIFRLMC